MRLDRSRPHADSANDANLKRDSTLEITAGGRIANLPMLARTLMGLQLEPDIAFRTWTFRTGAF